MHITYKHFESQYMLTRVAGVIGSAIAAGILLGLIPY
jgi:Na+-transporting methylmalonyl-CoA/oxaloacetate decarboxylase beta subunit